MTSTDRSKPRPATLHVDVGPALKQSVYDAATAAGVRPSDWVRDALQRVLEARESAVTRAAGPGAEPTQRDGPPWRRDRTVAAAIPTAASASIAVEQPAASHRRVTDIRLEPDDVALLDDVVKRAGFRSRSAALRYLLRVLAREAGTEAVDALAQLPKTIPALTDSNVVLQRWLARAGADLGAGSAPAGHPAQRSDAPDAACFRAHIEAVARVVAALRPLLVIRPSS